MTSTRMTSFTTSAILVIITCTLDTVSTETSQHLVDRLTDGILQFSLDLYKNLSSPGQNLFFSPASVSLAMGMTAAGAQGHTRDQMNEVLGFTGVCEEDVQRWLIELLAALVEKHGKYSLDIANRLYGQQGSSFLQKFLDDTRKYYNAELAEVNFGDAGTRDVINEWVAKQTNDKITELLKEDLSPDTRLMLVNAVYFQGDWLKQFDPKYTTKQNFTAMSGESIEVDMMIMDEEFKYDFISDINCDALVIPHDGEAFTMIIMLPREKYGLADLESKLTVNHVKSILLGTIKQQVKVSLPRFQIKQSYSLAETLSSLGMTDAFNRRADFSGMSEANNLYISSVEHEAYIAVNENGTEATAGATGNYLPVSAVPPPVFEFRADHPFLFFVRDTRSGTILFMGKLEEPPAAGEM